MSIALKTAALAALTITSAASAAAITPGNLVVYRVGDGSAALGNTGTAVFLDEYSPTGTLVQSIAQPTSGTGAVVASGSATSEGLISISPDASVISFTGYNAATGTAGVASTAAATVNRTIGVLSTGSVSNATAYTFITDQPTANNIRSATTTNGTDLFFDGGTGGIRTAPASASPGTSTQISAGTVVNFRQTAVFGGQLFASSQSGALRLATIGTGVSTAASQTVTNLPGLPTTSTGGGGNPYQFYFADLDATASFSGTGLDTLYIADNSAGITKYGFNGTTWVAEGTIASTGLTGLTAVVTGTSVTLYTSTGSTLQALTDATGSTGTLAGTPLTIATAGTNTAFRGLVANVATTPEPASLALIGLGGLVALRRRRAM